MLSHDLSTQTAEQQQEIAINSSKFRPVPLEAFFFSLLLHFSSVVNFTTLSFTFLRRSLWFFAKDFYDFAAFKLICIERTFFEGLECGTWRS